MDSDYQLALRLQNQLNYEPQTENATLQTDYQLAVNLQEEYHHEELVENPVNNLVYSQKKEAADSSKSLVDPSWEVIDPTPDIYVLFMAFNERFFWKKLEMVCVTWSTRMTSSAGVCSYHGRAGLCQISLSEPLLKLRPRKDLVETLLHEMIHAYLFVTRNNKDRSGHGPEFHKHMYRINAEAGTKITVYHNFYDEVNLYKQHWWRCNGPCKAMKPFYGLVRRTTNRAPGPRDLWWAKHQETCGGVFIKVKEPDAKPTKKKNDKATKPKDTSKGDIRKFIPNNSPNKVNSTNGNIHTVSSNSNTAVVTPVFSSKISSNIRGFTLVDGVIKEIKKNTVENGSSSVTGNKPSPNYSGASSESGINVTSPGGTVKKIFSPPKSNEIGALQSKATDAYVAVRNHWADKFKDKPDTSIIINGSKRLSSENTLTSPKSPKIRKDEPSTSTSANNISDLSLENVECPICADKFSLKELNIHLDFCTNKNESKECIICGLLVKSDYYEQHVSRCADVTFKDDFPKLESSNGATLKECPICYKKMESVVFDGHVKECSRLNLSGVIDLTVDDESMEEKFCPVCEKHMNTLLFENHVGKCLHTMYDKMEDTYTNKALKTKCLVCGKDIIKSELNAHLEDCMFDIFKDEFTVPDNEIACDNSEHNCPFCMKEFKEDEISHHIEECLHTDDDTSESQLNKSILLDSLTSDEI